MLIDTHAHVYHSKLAGDVDAVIKRAFEAGVTQIVMPAIDLPSIDRAVELCDRYEGLYAMAAIHPSDVKDASESDLEAVKEWCDDPRIVAVGESGLDYYWDRSFDDKQHEYFRYHIRLAAEKDLPLILHNREASSDIIRILREERDELPFGRKLRGILHCFGGPEWVVEAALDLDFLLGIGGTVTFKNAGVDKLVADIPLERIVLETDAPFLAPVPHRGKRNEPAYTRLVAEKVAEVKGLSLEEVAAATSTTAKNLFGI